jgi:nitrous oxidase accessory protein
VKTALAVALGAISLCACSAAQAPVDEESIALPARPERCVEIAPGQDLAPISSAEAASVFCLLPGVHRGPLAIASGVTVWGPREAIVRSTGEGTTVRVIGPGRLFGSTVDGSGRRFDLLDSAVHLEGDRPALIGATIMNATFGVIAERSEGATIEDNLVIGTGGAALGMRGDAIRLWEAHGATVARNRVKNARDVVVWYSSRARVEENVISGSRYGVHLMHSDDNLVLKNKLENDVVGVFVMYSRRVSIAENVVTSNGGAAGMGLGIKDSSEISIRSNEIVRSEIGLFLDNANGAWIEENSVRLGGAAVAFHGPAAGTTLVHNELRDNLSQARSESSGDGEGARWDENYFDDYAGYDLDRDGIGDVPYELRSLASDLAARSPELALFRGTPALFLAEAIAKALPIFTPKELLKDEHPRMYASREDR